MTSRSTTQGADAAVSEPPPPGWAQHVAFEQSVLQAAVALADTKASFLLASAMGMMIYLLNTLFGGHTMDMAVRAAMWIAALLMAVCASIAFAIIFPRIRDTDDDNVIYWGSPRFRGDRAAFAEHCLSLSHTHAVLLRQQTDHLHRIAAILRAKYTGLRVGLSVLGLGLMLFVAAQILR